SILPMGGSQAYKGFGLGLVLDVLAGGLTGGHVSRAASPPAKGNNVVFLALDPARFAGQGALIREATQLADYVRGCPEGEGVGTILLPGDPEGASLELRSANGIPIEEAHWARLTELANRLHVAEPALPVA